MNSGNNVDVSVYQGDVKQKSCGTLQLTYGLKQSDQIYTLVCDTEGDSVKLSKNTPDYIAVCEVVVVRQGNLTLSASQNFCICPIPKDSSDRILVLKKTFDKFHLMCFIYGKFLTKHLQDVRVSTQHISPVLSIFPQSYQYSQELFSR